MFTRSLVFWNAVMLIGFSVTLSSRLLAQLPADAIGAWQKHRLCILEMNTLAISADSFSTTIDIKDSSDEDQSEEKVFVAKLADSVLVSSTRNGIEKRLLFRDGKSYEIQRKANAVNWTLSNTGKYEPISGPVNDPDSNAFLVQLLPSNHRLLRLWSLADASWDKRIESWEKPEIDNQANTLAVTVEFPGKTMRLEFDKTKEFSLKSIHDVYKNSVGESLTVFQNLSKDFSSFTSIEKASWVDKAGVKRERSEEIVVATDTSAPASEIFDLAYYNLQFRKPLQQSSQMRYLWGPILVGVALIALAVYLKRG